MIYKVTTLLYFDDPDEARDYFHDGEVALVKAININPGQPDEEHSWIKSEDCFHDHDPNGECITTEYEQKPD